jgi:two-component system cell cycle response regulator
MALDGFDPLRLCSQLRTVEMTRSTPILLIADDADRPQVVRALDIGINDFIMRPLEKNELSARVRTQIRRHRYAMELRESVSSTMQLAVVDEMTGLYNRRYFDRHLSLMLGKAQSQERDMALVIFDIDHFNSVNDTHGHVAGDAVIRVFSTRLRRIVRGVDMACRYGGEEFVVIMPDTDFEQARSIAERVRAAVADCGFDIGGGRFIKATVSAGVSMNDGDKDTPGSFLKRADIALYQAKQQGRNRVVFDAA